MEKEKLAELEKLASDYMQISNRYFSLGLFELSFVKQAVEKAKQNVESRIINIVMEDLGYEFLDVWGMDKIWRKK